MATRVIAPVGNTTEKYETYRTLMGRYSQAIKHKFYFEAMLIDYALLEDRLRSWLFHFGIIPERNSMKISKIAKNELSYIVDANRANKRANGLAYKNISSKIDIIRALVIWAKETDGLDVNSKYLKAIKNQLESVDGQEVLETLDAIDFWRDYRNEVVHSLMNKNILCISETLAKQAVAGKEYAAILDKNLKILKKGNMIRRAANLK